MQSTLTDFRFLRASWRRNAEQLRLLGVSLTGVMDHPVMSGQEGEAKLIKWLTEMREYAYEVNREWAKRLEINESAAICTIKPSGTVSQLASCASGQHPVYAPYYARTIRQDRKDPICEFLIDAGVPHEPCVMKPDSTMVFTFPQKSPEGSLTIDDVGTIQQLELCKLYNQHWSCHTCSLTAYYDGSGNDYFEVCQWIWDNFDYCIGVSFLPRDNGTYEQAPYTRITKEEYDRHGGSGAGHRLEQAVAVRVRGSHTGFAGTGLRRRQVRTQVSGCPNVVGVTETPSRICRCSVGYGR